MNSRDPGVFNKHPRESLIPKKKKNTGKTKKNLCLRNFKGQQDGTGITFNFI